MKKRLRALLFALSLGVLALVLAVRLSQRGTTFLGARLADAEQLAVLQAGPQVSGEDCILHWNGAVLPYDSAQGAYCVPQPAGGETRGNLSSSWGDIYLPAEHWGGDMTAAMREGTLLPVYVSDGSRWCELFAYVSGMPALVVRTQESVPYRLDPNIVSGTMAKLELAYNYSDYTLFWPEGNARGQLTKGSLEWHWRGNTSLLANKKTYRLNLLDLKKKPKREDLLGLGDDADWILMNFATDCTRARDKVTWQVWQQLVQQTEYNPAGLRVEYVELYLDDQYMGVYGLCRPISRDSLGLSARDTLYKWRTMPMDRRMPTTADFEQLEADESLAWGMWLEVAWPKSWSEGLWRPMQQYVEQFYTPAQPPEWQRLEETTNLANLIDVALFKQYICAMDNFCYNQYFWVNSADGLYYRIPWDLDYSLGDRYDEFYELDLTKTVIPDMELDALYEADPARAQSLIAGRWAELRQTVFTVENMAAILQEATNALESTGAMRRDFALWGKDATYPNAPHFRTLEVNETLELLEDRLAYLDEYMANYTPPDRSAFNVLPQ
ncbi:hypothetical protein CE91St44_08580 [Oscillospiraceae bacterium]|nr:hypothetical protein CE91St44_08580 [Oscillospiraceae bacterium]